VANRRKQQQQQQPQQQQQQHEAVFKCSLIVNKKTRTNLTQMLHFNSQLYKLIFGT
jgi:hypothetical protein